MLDGGMIRSSYLKEAYRGRGAGGGEVKSEGKQARKINTRGAREISNARNAIWRGILLQSKSGLPKQHFQSESFNR